MSSIKDICKIVAFKCLKKQLDLWFYMLLSRVLTLSQILKKLQQRQIWHNVHFLHFLCRNLHFMWFGAPRNVWDYKSQVWNNSSDVTTDKTHYVMTVWLVFWSKRVWNALPFTQLHRTIKMISTFTKSLQVAFLTRDTTWTHCDFQ